MGGGLSNFGGLGGANSLIGVETNILSPKSQFNIHKGETGDSHQLGLQNKPGSNPESAVNTADNTQLLRDRETAQGGSDSPRRRSSMH